MNKLMIAVFDNETAAEAGLQALHQLHTQGAITVYATGVVVKEANGQLRLKQSTNTSPIGTRVGLAVGSLIGLLGGPAGLVLGAVTGSVVGAVRDFWVAGVGLDFIEEADTLLLPGKVALLAELEEEWVIPVDTALEALGGRVLRRSRAEVSEAQFDRDIATFRAEIVELETEALDASGAAKEKLQTKVVAAQGSLDAAVQRGQQRVDALKQEADAKLEALVDLVTV